MYECISKQTNERNVCNSVDAWSTLTVLLFHDPPDVHEECLERPNDNKTQHTEKYDMKQRRRTRRLVAISVVVITLGYLLVACNLVLQHVDNDWKHNDRRSSTSPMMIPDRAISIQNPQDISSVDYMACCGAGHRTSKLAEANYLARHMLGFGLRVYWGYCDTYETRHQQTEVFQYVKNHVRLSNPSH